MSQARARVTAVPDNGDGTTDYYFHIRDDLTASKVGNVLAPRHGGGVLELDTTALLLDDRLEAGKEYVYRCGGRPGSAGSAGRDVDVIVNAVIEKLAKLVLRALSTRGLSISKG